MVSVGNSKDKWWWRCEAGHEWQRTVAHQVTAKKVCPDCTNSRARATYNIAVLHPELAAEWHPTRNEGLQPTEFTPGSEFMAWWRCRTDACSHVWQAMIGNRARLGVGCPRCGDRRVSEFRSTPKPGTSLADLFPGLLVEWHPTRNGDVTPYDVNPGAQVKVWWRCGTCRHDWHTRVENRTVKGSGCPACANKVVTAVNNLAAVRPELAAEWHPALNDGLGPI
ncbi:zinc-ribbon domain-containing protein [Dactylosporangium sp. CA-233914]|uniref:zinc-ribbon domain-containing protein n=1 Tax=Dactylosporangium sp. CA-233914 TaxID=3239934 RepID=UPI003D9251F5